MNKEIQESIYKYTGKRCVSGLDIKSGDGLRNHYRIILDDGTEYLCKILKMSKERLDVYQKIVDMNISCFQKTCFIWLLRNDQYVVLVEWNEGKLITEYEFEENDYLIKLVERTARMIRQVHDDLMSQEKIFISRNDIESVFEKNRDLLDDESWELLKAYVLENCHYLNGRNQTVIHGDLHFHNILNTADGILVIDIDDCEFGDPYKDLIYASNLIKSKDESQLYYQFLMNYFENQIPQDFWIIVNVYSIYKALQIMRCEKEYTNNHEPIYSLRNFVKQHKRMTSHVPLWFEESGGTK